LTIHKTFTVRIWSDLRGNCARAFKVLLVYFVLTLWCIQINGVAMKAVFGILGLLVVLAIVGVLAKKQLSTVAASPGVSPQQQSQQIQQQVKQSVEASMQQEQARQVPDEK
jgi:hypothetical protein